MPLQGLPTLSDVIRGVERRQDGPLGHVGVVGVLTGKLGGDLDFPVEYRDKVPVRQLVKQDWHYASILGLSTCIGVRITSTKTASESSP